MSNRIYIGRVQGIPQADLLSYVSTLGQVNDFMMKDTFAFVEYSNEHEASKAVVQLDGRCINGQRIMAEFSKTKAHTDSSYFNIHPRIYVGRLNLQITKEQLVEEFGKYGEIQDILKKDDFAFIEYTLADSAIRAIKELHGREMLGTKISVEEARPQDDVKQVAYPRLYVGKLGPEITQAHLTACFGYYGELVDILMKDNYAFIEFNSIAAASRALADTDGIQICSSQIHVEEAKPKQGEKFENRYPFKTQTNVPLVGSDEQKFGVKIRGKRLSPRRSLSQSRSRSAEQQSSLPPSFMNNHKNAHNHSKNQNFNPSFNHRKKFL